MSGIEAELPDGTILEFPDGTPDTVVQAKVREYLGAASQPARVNPPMSGPGSNEMAEADKLARNQRPALTRLVEPMGQAARAALGLPGALGRGASRYAEAVRALSQLDPKPMADMGGDIVHGVVDPQVEQGRKALDAVKRGDWREAGVHGSAAAVPILGPQAAGIHESLDEGNYAGAVGEVAANALPFAAKPLAGLAKAGLTSRAAAQALEALGPGKASRKMLATLKANPDLIEKMGVGGRETLLKRAEAQRALAAQGVEDLQGIKQPVNIDPAINAVEARASQERIALGISPQTGKPVSISGNPALERALVGEQATPQALADAYGGNPPAGEVFRLRAQIGRRSATAYDRPAGSLPPVSSAAPQVMREELSSTLHNQVAGSKVRDAAYSNWNKITNRLSKSVETDLNAKGRASFGDYLKGRIASTVLGAASGGAIGGLPGAALGGLTGATLAKSPFWHSLKATTYTKMARYINVGDNAAAFVVLQNAAKDFEFDESIKELERNRKASEALQAQAEGVVAP